MSYKQYFAIEKQIKQLGVDIDRDEIIHNVTAGRKDSLRDLTAAEYRELIYAMNQLLGNSNSAKFKKMDKQRKKIIALLCKVGYTKNGVADMPRINQWCEKYGYLHKSLNSYTEKELPFLVSQAENVYKKFIKSL
jgi:hypothetical protein